ncbi:MAG: ATP-binding cassette domain-containing protein [Bacilli bacterium]|nr:ATP-binding cassette domain-containing protein [Bacilli bacterium]
MAEVIIKNVKKIYSGNVTAVHDFNLHIKDKEFIVFVGPSGCGKSTTLRMVAGLEDISEGTISIDGEVVNDLQPKDRHISMVFQNYALYPHLTVYENMAFPLRIDKKERIMPLSDEEKEKARLEVEELRKQGKNDKADKLEDEIANGRKQKGYTDDQIYERIINAAQVLGITQFLTRKPKAMSGGQRQRVAIGRAMVKDCKVFLMDEPLSNLDAKLRNQMRAEIILLRKRINTTFIYVTHDQTEAMTLGDRIVCMKDGFIMQVGTPTELFDMPANLFVAQFVGAPMMNTVHCDLIREGNKYFVNPYGYKLPVDGDKGKALLDRDIESRPIILGIRPEHIQLSSGKDGVPVTIQVNEMMGSEYHLHVTTEQGEKLIVRIPTLSLSDEERANMVNGTQIKVSFSGKAMHFFDPESEKNLLVDITNADAYELDADIVKQEKQEELPKSDIEE